MRVFQDELLHHLLCGGRDPLPALPAIDLGAFIARCWHLAGYLAHRMCEDQVLELNGQSFTQRQLAEAADWLHELQRAEISRACEALKSAGISYALLKGTATSFLAYERSHRLLGDMDVAVAPNQIFKARDVLEGIGYRTCGWNRAQKRYELLDRATASAQEQGHYQLAMLVRRRAVKPPATWSHSANTVALAHRLFSPMLVADAASDETIFTLEIDLHHSIAANIPITNEIQDAKAVAANGSPLLASSPESVLAHIVLKLYYEGIRYGKGGHQYADCSQLTRLISEPGWAHFWSLIARWKAEPAGYYVLRRLYQTQQAMNDSITGGMRSAAQRMQLANRMMTEDLGDPWDKIWGWRI